MTTICMTPLLSQHMEWYSFPKEWGSQGQSTHLWYLTCSLIKMDSLQVGRKVSAMWSFILVSSDKLHRNYHDRHMDWDLRISAPSWYHQSLSCSFCPWSDKDKTWSSGHILWLTKNYFLFLPNDWYQKPYTNVALMSELSFSQMRKVLFIKSGKHLLNNYIKIKLVGGYSQWYGWVIFCQLPFTLWCLVLGQPEQMLLSNHYH